jgi:hypothetical protein
LTNQNEKKDATKKSLSEILSRFLENEYVMKDGEDTKVADLERELAEARKNMDTVNPSNNAYVHITNLWFRVLANRLIELHGYRLLLASLYILSRQMDEISTIDKTAIIDTQVEEGLKKIDEKIAKRLAQLLDMKGHEAMYDTGTNPSRSN